MLDGAGVKVALAELDAAQWESLCDGCGRCCMCKFEDEDSGEMLYTDVACPLLDIRLCRCQNYLQRQQKVPDCLDIRHFTDQQFRWLPSTCAYRLAHEGKPLPPWHPWMSGNPQSVHRCGISIRDKVHASSEGMNEDAIIARIIDLDTDVSVKS
ncbi:MAG: YcgN family cysteine cluster protein [Mariprofundales bacterium]